MMARQHRPLLFNYFLQKIAETLWKVGRADVEIVMYYDPKGKKNS